MGRVVHRGVLLCCSGRVPCTMRIIIRRFGRRTGVVRVHTVVCIRQSSRGKVVVKGRKGTLGGITARTHQSLRHFFKGAIFLRACMGISGS